MAFAAREFGQGRQFRDIEEYNEALKTINKALFLQKTVLAEPAAISEEDVRIDGEFSADRVVAELKVQSDRVEDRVNDIDRRMESLERKMSDIMRAIERISEIKRILNKDGIPIGTILHGTSCGSNFEIEATEDGYKLGEHKFPSLSAAALAVSGNMRSGWVFWKLPTGQPAETIRCHQ